MIQKKNIKRKSISFFARMLYIFFHIRISNFLIIKLSHYQITNLIIMHIPESILVHIKENSIRARIAAFNMGANCGLAMVWGNTILLFNVSKQDFLQDKQWVCHEIRHVLQSNQIGKWRFLWRYVVLGIKHGYHHHPYEVDARLHDADYEILDRVKWL
jgi:hypothetical protein